MAGALVYEGCQNFRMRLVMSVLTGKTVRISNIRHEDDEPGVKDFEMSFIHLLDKLTNGTHTNVSPTGTKVIFTPGLLLGGSIEHDCHVSRSIGYYLEMILCLAAFTKEPIQATLRGVTCDKDDPSVDLIKMSVLPVLKQFLGTDENLELKVKKRGAAPEGGGEVFFSCPCRQKLRPMKFLDPGKIRKIRGVAWSTRVSPKIVNRLVDSSRSILNKFLTDIYIYTDHMKGSQSGKSPGFGLTLVAESTTGVFLAAEEVSKPQGSGGEPTIPEDLAKKAVMSLLHEIHRGGCVDSTSQSMTALLMVLGQHDVSKVQTGELTQYSMDFLRHIRDFFKVTFRVEADKKPRGPPTDENEEGEELRVGGDKLILTCVGVGYTNISRAVR